MKPTMKTADFVRAFREAPKKSIFCGSGVSRSAPSSLPLFSELMRSYLTALDPPGRNVLKVHAGQEAENIRSAICELPIDEFFADVILALGKETLEPIDWMSTREPNQAHRLIAKLVESLDITTVLTPNFDKLLEKKLVGFESVTIMKGRSRTYEDGVLSGLNVPDASNKPLYLDPSFKRVFHLHGTSLRGRIEITPGATAVAFDHFDHANLAERLCGTTLLVVGSSGSWDYAILDILKRCDIAQVLWVCHNNNHKITEGVVPQPWLDFFDGRVVAIRGNTTMILAELAQEEYQDIEAGDVAEFEANVVDHFNAYESRGKLYIWAVLANKVMRGDVANSILSELEQKFWKPSKQDEKELAEERKFLKAIKKTDSLTMKDGRRITPEQFLREYEGKKSINIQSTEKIWEVIIGRTRAVAMSRDQRNGGKKKESIAFLKGEVIAKLEKIIPFNIVALQKLSKKTWAAREWLLVQESLGVLHFEDGNTDSAIDRLSQALQICRNEDDRYRIQSTIVAVECARGLDDLFGVSGFEELQAIFDDRKIEIDPQKVEKLIKTTDQLYFTAGRRIQALRLYKTITQRWPDNVDACLNYSNILRVLREFKHSLGELDRCLKIKPDDYRLICNKGYALNELGRQREAIGVLKKALKICNSDKHAWVNLGNSYYEINRLREALDKYQQALDCDPDFEVAKINKEKTLMRLAKRIW